MTDSDEALDEVVGSGSDYCGVSHVRYSQSFVAFLVDSPRLRGAWARVIDGDEITKV